MKENDIVIITDTNHGWYGCIAIIDLIKSDAVRVKMRKPYVDGFFFANSMRSQIRKVGEL